MFLVVSEARRTGLCNGDHVVASQNGGNAVRLNGSRSIVLAKLDVLEHDGVQTSILKLWSSAWRAVKVWLGGLHCGQG